VTRQPFEYALVRVVPSIARGEVINAGVLVYCRRLDYLGARVHLDVARLRALDTTSDAAAITAALQRVADVCDGRLAEPDPGKRFRWLTAPRSTVIQSGPVHTGLTDDPDAEADRLLRLLVMPR